MSAKPSGLNLEAEIAQVQRELRTLRDEYLPIFFPESWHDVLPGVPAEILHERMAERSGQLSSWLTAATSLGAFLPIDSHDAPPPSADEFKDHLFSLGTPSYRVEHGRIAWAICIYSIEITASHCYTGNAESGEEVKRKLLAQAPSIKQWLFGLPVDSCLFFNALCSIVPILADQEPMFAKLALDPDTWRLIVENDKSITGEEKTKRLKMIDGIWFGHLLNNTLLHVLAALANNRFIEIRDFLDHRNILGGYTNLMPHYLFAVLFHKVTVLCELAKVHDRKSPR